MWTNALESVHFISVLIDFFQMFKTLSTPPHQLILNDPKKDHGFLLKPKKCHFNKAQFPPLIHNTNAKIAIPNQRDLVLQIITPQLSNIKD